MAEVGPGTVLASRYRLEHRLGQGGMGTVWAAAQIGLGVRFAVKLMDAELARTEIGRQRFEREARILATLRTPHVVQVFDHGVHENVPYLVMEVLDGEDLLGRLKRMGTLSIRELEPIVVQIAKGLSKAHEAGLVHRDLKPANVFLVDDDGHDLVKILDFGIAKSTNPSSDDTVTSTGVVIGSPHYMSPEQARGLRGVDFRSDLWSVGVIAFRALTGARPFDGEGTGDVLLQICTAPLPLASQIAPGLPPVVDAFFARALAREPNDRFSSARELAQAFSSIASQVGAAGELAHPPPPGGSRQLASPISVGASAVTGPSGTSIVQALPASAISGRGPAMSSEIKDVTTGTAIATGPRPRARRSMLWMVAAALALGGLAGAGALAITTTRSKDEPPVARGATAPAVAASEPERAEASAAPIASAADPASKPSAVKPAVRASAAPGVVKPAGPPVAPPPAATAPCKANEMFGVPCGHGK